MHLFDDFEEQADIFTRKNLAVVHHIPKANMETQRSPQPMGSGR